MEFSRRLNDADARYFFLGERPDCNVAMTLVTVVGGEVSLEELVAEFVPSEGGIPRFADYLRRAPLGLAPPVWMPLPEEERVTERYGREVHLPPGVGWGEVFAIIDEAQSAPFDPRCAPWGVVVIKGVADGRTVLAMRAHHVLSDGMAFAMMFTRTFAGDILAAADVAIEVETEPPPRAPRLWLALAHRGASFRDWLREVARKLPALLTDRERRRGELAAMRTMLRPRRRFPLRAHGRARRLNGFRVPASAWRSEAEARGGASNELFLALAARITRRALPEVDFDAEPIRLGMPIGRRAGTAHDGGNVAKVGLLELTGGDGEIEDLGSVRVAATAVKQAMAATRPTLFETTLDLLPGRLRAAIEFRLAVSCDVLATNIPVPRAGRILGVPVEEMLMVAPAIGQLVSFSVTEYEGHFHLAVNSDAALVPDSIVICAEEVLAELFGGRAAPFGAVGASEPEPEAAVGGVSTGTAIRWDRALNSKNLPD